MFVFECQGRDEYSQQPIPNDPWKREQYYNNGKVFRDIWTWNVGYQYTPEQLGITGVLPEFFTDTNGITYRKREVKEIDNHAFSQQGRQGPRLHTPNTTGETFVPFVTEKKQVPDSSGWEQSSTISELKKAGLLKQ
jgi:hypothetical protein